MNSYNHRYGSYNGQYSAPYTTVYKPTGDIVPTRATPVSVPPSYGTKALPPAPTTNKDGYVNGKNYGGAMLEKPMAFVPAKYEKESWFYTMKRHTLGTYRDLIGVGIAGGMGFLAGGPMGAASFGAAAGAGVVGRNLHLNEDQQDLLTRGAVSTARKGLGEKPRMGYGGGPVYEVN